MSRLHKTLNTVLPLALRTRLRRLALSAIPSMRHLDMPVRLKHVASLGFDPRVILDIGAAEGHWAAMAHACWPRASIFGFEPNRRNEPSLRATQAKIPAFNYRLCFLGPEARTIEYFDNDKQTSVLDSSGEGNKQTAPMLVLDELIARGEVPPPDFLKLDVQGFELDVLSGAQGAMRNAQAVLLEVGFFEFFPGVPTIDKVVAYMKDRGYQWYDIMGLLRRPSDDALWQIDVMFIKHDHPLRRAGWP